MPDKPPFSTPEITPAQVVAVLASVLGVATAFGAPIGPVQKAQVVDLVQTTAPVLIGADAFLRYSRAKHADRIVEARQKLGVHRPSDEEMKKAKQMSPTSHLPIAIVLILLLILFFVLLDWSGVNP